MCVSSSNLPLTQDPPATVDPASSTRSASSPGSTSGSESGPGHAAAGAPAQLDALAAAAVELARQAAEETAEPNTVGEHLGVSVDDGGLTMHSFATTARGYRGWRWAVTLARVPDSEVVTVCDVVLLPGTDSILAPTWVPWSDRLAPGDLGAGDDLPYRADDPLLVPGYTVTDPDDDDQQLFWELGLGRERVVGLEGLQGAAERWEHGPHGPTSEIAIQASASCVTCAYFLPVSGFLRQHFGACTNEWSPADGTVVTTDFGCGAHSETDLELPAPEPLPAHILDETVVERVIINRDQPAADGPDDVSAEPSSEQTQVTEADLEAPAAAEPGAVTEPGAMAEPLVVEESLVAETAEVAEAEPFVAEAEPEVSEPELSAEPVKPEAAAQPSVVPEPEAIREPEAATYNTEPAGDAESGATQAEENGSAEPPAALESALEVLAAGSGPVPEELVELITEFAPESVLEPVAGPPIGSFEFVTSAQPVELIEPVASAAPVASAQPSADSAPTQAIEQGSGQTIEAVTEPESDEAPPAP